MYDEPVEETNWKKYIVIYGGSTTSPQNPIKVYRMEIAHSSTGRNVKRVFDAEDDWAIMGFADYDGLIPETGVFTVPRNRERGHSLIILPYSDTAWREWKTRESLLTRAWEKIARHAFSINIEKLADFVNFA
jgi:hypothetical protein